MTDIIENAVLHLKADRKGDSSGLLQEDSYYWIGALTEGQGFVDRVQPSYRIPGALHNGLFFPDLITFFDQGRFVSETSDEFHIEINPSDSHIQVQRWIQCDAQEFEPV